VGGRGRAKGVEDWECEAQMQGLRGVIVRERWGKICVVLGGGECGWLRAGWRGEGGGRNEGGWSGETRVND